MVIAAFVQMIAGSRIQIPAVNQRIPPVIWMYQPGENPALKRPKPIMSRTVAVHLITFIITKGVKPLAVERAARLKFT